MSPTGFAREAQVKGQIEAVRGEILELATYLRRNSHPTTTTGNCRHSEVCESSLHCSGQIDQLDFKRVSQCYEKEEVKRTVETSDNRKSTCSGFKNFIYSNISSSSNIDPFSFNSANSINENNSQSLCIQQVKAEKYTEWDRFVTNNEFDSSEVTIPPYPSPRCKFINGSFIEY